MDMTPEFIVLAFVLILAIVQIAAAAVARTAERGPSGTPGRATRRLHRRANWPDD